MALLENIKEKFISLTSQSDWENVLNDMSEELNKASLDGNITVFTSKLRDVKQFYNITDPQIDDLETISLLSAQNITELVVLGRSSLNTNIKVENFIKATVLLPNIGNKFTSISTFDTNNVSNNDANLINGNLTNFCYNNTSTGTVNKPFVGIDLGSVQNVGLIQLTHWNNQSYTASNYKFEGSNDLNNWTDIVTNLDSSGLEGTTTSLYTDVNFRYIRPFCVQGNNPTYWVISELELYEKGTGESENLIDTVKTLSIEIDVNNFVIINNKGTDKTIKLYHI